MFSPDSTLHSLSGSTSRNPRRRQRKDDESSRQAPLRKRSKLSEETFLPPANGKVNGNGSIGANGYAPHPSASHSSHTLEIPLREKKSSGVLKRASKGDGSIVLVKNANYVAKKLPSFPERFRDSPLDHFRAFTLQSRPYTLALTHDHAYIFDYTTSNHPAVPRTLPLPFALKRTDPLPVGSIVQVGPSNEIGVVVVAPTTGKITFWENVDSAESLTLFQQRRQGVEGSVGNMFNGETVTDIIDAGPAGFVLRFSSGRLAQLTVRDAQGRPRIEVMFLRVGGNGSGGLFGSFKNVITGGAWKRDIAAVKTRPSALKGQMEVITATKSGTFQLWDLNWEGHHIFKSEINIHNDLFETVRGDSPPESRGQLEAQVIDFTILPSANGNGSGTEVSLMGDTFLPLLVLVALKGPSSLSYALVEVDLVGDNASIRRLIPVDVYQPDDISSDVSGTLLVPSPGHTAFILFNQAIVVASLMEKEESPDDQLMADAGAAAPRPFQDVIFIRKNAKLQFVGHAIEEPHKKENNARCVLFARGFGIIRLTALAPDPRPSVERERVTAKSKIEQAIFFGALPGTIIDFTRKSNFVFSQQEIEDAAIRISNEILSSTSEYIPTVLPSMEQHLNMRASALEALAGLLKLHYPPLSRQTKWHLLWNAEKLAAGSMIWTHYQNRLRAPIADEPLLEVLVFFLHERYKTELRPEIGEKDPTRQFFIYDLGQIQLLIPWAYKTIQATYDEGGKDNSLLIRIVSEADDVTLGGLKTAFAFREEKLGLYGLQDEQITDGVLETGYEDLPQFWTSTHNIVNNTKQLTDLARMLSIKCYGDDEREPISEEKLVHQVVAEAPTMVEICCLIHTERYRWCLAQNDQKTRATGRSLREEFEGKTRTDLLLGLPDIGQAYEAMNIAEKFRDMHTLVALVAEETYYLQAVEVEAESAEERENIAAKLVDIRKRIKRYFDTFGYEWAHAFFSSHIRRGQGAALFDKDLTSEKYLTKFLRSDPSRAKLSWINDVLGEKDLPAAAASLMTVAESQEPNMWCQKIETSLAKLALMAVEPQQYPDRTKLEKLAKRNQMGLKIIEIQEELYSYIKPTVIQSLDDEVAIEQCMELYGDVHLRDRPAFRQILRQGFEQLINHHSMEPALLIDVLTLMAPSGERFEDRVDNNQYFMALEVLDASWDLMDNELREATLRLIWKRLLIKDDWRELNNTRAKNDEELEAQFEALEVYEVLVRSADETEAFQKPSRFIPIPPSDCLGAGSSPSHLAARFPSEDLRDPIIQDNMADDATLRLYLEQCRLEHWFDAMKEKVEGIMIEVQELELERQERQVAVMEKLLGDRGGGVVDDAESESGSREGSGSGMEGDDERVAGGRFDDDGDADME